MNFEDAAREFIPSVPESLYPLIRTYIWIEGTTREEARKLLDRNSEKWHVMYRLVEKEKWDKVKQLKAEYDLKLNALDSPNAEYELLSREQANKEFGVNINEKLWREITYESENHKAGCEVNYVGCGPSPLLWRCSARKIASRSTHNSVKPAGCTGVPEGGDEFVLGLADEDDNDDEEVEYC